MRILDLQQRLQKVSLGIRKHLGQNSITVNWCWKCRLRLHGLPCTCLSIGKKMVAQTRYGATPPTKLPASRNAPLHNTCLQHGTANHCWCSVRQTRSEDRLGGCNARYVGMVE